MSATAFQRWKVGDVTITKILEQELEGILEHIIEPATPDNLMRIPWIGPFVTDAGLMKWSIHALVVETPTRKIVVDTCIGNDKARPALPIFDHMQKGFLQDLEAAGYPRESIDTVLCTHLHVDHVGWNTMWVGGRWVPTFPNARYLLSKPEFAHWKAEDDRAKAAVKDESGAIDNSSIQNGVFDDSIYPVFDAGLVDLVEMSHRICDEVRLVPTPGHTPGHVSVEIASKGERAIITGDLVHHPCQIAHPEWSTNLDTSMQASCDERKKLYADVTKSPALVIGTHWITPTAGRIVRDGDSHRLDI